MPIISLQQVKKNYPLGKTTVHALRGIDFSVEEGELLAIVGPSGSGKTTLLNIIGCIDVPSEGRAEIAGKDISFLTDKEITDLRLYKLGFIFQTFNLIPVLNILENVEFPLMLMHNFSAKETRTQAEKVIDDVGLTPYIKHKPAELSGGQRQRVAIARALVTKPSIVLADEPTANLDSETGEQILQLMKTLNEHQKTTFIFSTHDHNVIQYAKRIVQLKDGLIVADKEDTSFSLASKEPTKSNKIHA